MPNTHDVETYRPHATRLIAGAPDAITVIAGLLRDRDHYQGEAQRLERLLCTVLIYIGAVSIPFDPARRDQTAELRYELGQDGSIVVSASLL